MTDSKETKHIETTLDHLPYGDESIASLSGVIQKTPFPEGVTRRMLIKDVIMIAWPSLIELVLTQLTSIADQIMVGRLPGQAGINGLAAVGLAAQPKFLLMTMIQAMNVGSTAIIARFRGQQNREKANQVFKQALLLNLVMATLFMSIGLLFGEPLIRFMSGSGISEETLALGVDYLKIQMYGFIPLCFSFTVTAALRGIGDTRTPMLYNTVANVLNLVFNYLMIYGKFGFPAMGVAGASWATIIGQTVACVIALVVVLAKKHYVYFSFKEPFAFDGKIMGSVVNIGLPSMIEQLFMRAGIMIFSRTVASLGDTMFATHQVCMSIQAMSFMIGQAFANAATTLMGQSIGKHRHDMAAIYMRQTRNVGIAVSLFLMGALILFNRNIIAMYNNNEEVVAIGSQILILIALSQPIQADQFVVSGGLRGAGDTKYTAMVMLITVLGVRSGFGLILVSLLDWGLWGAWIALIADQCLRTILMGLRYHSGKWKRMA